MTTIDSTQQTEVNSRHITLRVVSLALVILGLFISGYLSYVNLTEVPMICVANSDVFNCEVVQNSVYSRVAGIPIAWFGFAVYIVLFVLLLLENRVPFLKENGIILVFGITLFAWLYSVYLVYLQFFVLRALCPWCLAHEATITVIFFVSILRLRKSLMAG